MATEMQDTETPQNLQHNYSEEPIRRFKQAVCLVWLYCSSSSLPSKQDNDLFLGLRNFELLKS